jgi:hypothetical protein
VFVLACVWWWLWCCYWWVRMDGLTDQKSILRGRGREFLDLAEAVVF